MSAAEDAARRLLSEVALAAEDNPSDQFAADIKLVAETLLAAGEQRPTAEGLGLPPGHTMICNVCGADLLADGHEPDCPTR